MGQLDGINLKLHRADSHFEVLRDGLNRFRKTAHNRIPGKFDSKSKEYIFYAPEARFPRLDPVWGAVIGDVVHNLYATLDYIVCAMYRSSNIGDCTTSTSFPVFTSEAWYDGSGGAQKKLRGIDPLAQAIIKGLQPFAGGASPAEAARHPLALLYALEQWDKHRAINITVERTLSQIGGLPSYFIAPPPRELVMPEERHAIFVRWPQPCHLCMEVYFETACQIVFDSGGPAPREDVIQTLNSARRFVAEYVIPSLKCFIR